MVKLYCRYARWVQQFKINVAHDMNKQQKKRHYIIILIDAEKAFDDIHLMIFIKKIYIIIKNKAKLSVRRNRRNFLNSIMMIYKKNST